MTMGRTYTFTIGTAETGMRLDHYLVRRLPAAVSRMMIQRSIRGGHVTLEQRAAKPHYRLRSGDVISAYFEELPSHGGDTPLTPQEIPFEIIHEDPQVLVVNKPPGLVTHPAPGHWDGTLVNAIVWHLGQGEATKPHNGSSEAAPPRAGIVHRLDKDTSGLLLVAKTATTHVALSRQLKARTIHRRYLAVVEGHLPLNVGTVNAAIGRHQVNRKLMTVRHLGGRTAVTHYRVVRRIERSGARYTLVDVSLDTGRTHQIRVHLAHLGYPVVGDTVYGRHGVAFWQGLGVPRQLLHAYRITFQHPSTKKAVTLEAPLPEDIAGWCDAESRRRLQVAV